MIFHNSTVQCHGLQRNLQFPFSVPNCSNWAQSEDLKCGDLMTDAYQSLLQRQRYYKTLRALHGHDGYASAGMTKHKRLHR